MEILSNSNFGSQIRNLKVTNNKETNEPFGQNVSQAAHEKNEVRKSIKLEVSLNQQIIESTFSTTATEKSLVILSRETLDQVIESLNKEFEDASIAIDDIQTAYDDGLDVSPEATAERIVSLSTAFFDAYKEQHTELSDEEAANAFVEVISGGIEKGFKEARDILSNLNILEQGEIASNIDKTYDLVQDGLKTFLNGVVKSGDAQLADEDLEPNSE